MNIDKLIEEVKNEKDMLSRVSFVIGWMKNESEQNGTEKQFSANEVLELLKSIRQSNND